MRLKNHANAPFLLLVQRSEISKFCNDLKEVKLGFKNQKFLEKRGRKSLGVWTRCESEKKTEWNFRALALHSHSVFVDPLGLEPRLF